MKIGIDVHSLGSGKGGNETYYRYLVGGLSALDRHNDYWLYCTKQSARELSHSVPENFRVEPLKSSSSYFRIPVELPRNAKRDSLDIFHAQFIVPPGLKCKTVAAIFDITYEHFPQAFPAYQRLWSKILIRSSARRADHIVTVSEHSKKDIAHTYGIPEERITVTPLGAPNTFFPRNQGQAKELLAREYGIGGPFILYLGRLQARKNLLRLVEAFNQVRRAGFPHKLVLAGKRDSLFGTVLARIRDLKLANMVILPGFVRDEHIPFFYSAADLFVFPSLYEGFGLPVIEAMACGVPVITSRGSSLEEVAGNAALLIDPLEEASIARAMTSALADGTLRAHLREAGIKRASDFSQEKTAKKTLTVYQNLLGITPEPVSSTEAQTGALQRSY
jgi:glycosyltransferase involved in cell wall biosynthesis